ncbi:thioredoxin family protein [Legionella tunisiensis]|uniref:thioredoxin family protein n=1 Tax=Legionella tunisiensis TaxID=1034944 RepID=UPI0002E0F17E|nr:thioredoxin family protein [Legionella tunisiensis]
MPVNTIKTDQFEGLLANHEIVFIDFWAEWCVPCKQFAMVYEKVAEQNKTVEFAKVNIEEEAELAEIFQIRSIPHLMIFKQGIAIYSEAGSMPESTLKELVQQAVSVDVSEIRAKIDKGEI